MKLRSVPRVRRRRGDRREGAPRTDQTEHTAPHRSPRALRLRSLRSLRSPISSLGEARMNAAALVAGPGPTVRCL